MTEFEIIARYFTRPVEDADVLLGVGDDAALLRVDGALAVTVDTLVEGVHFPAGIAPDALGYRLLAVNLSDLAAMGAAPRWCTLALTLPAVEEGWLEGFARGLFELASRHGVSLVGGNLARGPLNCTMQLLGRVTPAEALRRGGGRPGEDVYVTGTLGDGAGGLAVLRQRGTAGPGAGGGGAPGGPADAREALVTRFLRPEPRIAAGMALRGIASAAIDVSDGLAADLGHLSRASGCGAIVDVERIPLSAALTACFAPDAALAHALGGGDDYELCFAAPSAAAARVAAAAAGAGTRATRIGRLVAGAGLEWRREGEAYAPAASGYLHF